LTQASELFRAPLQRDAEALAHARPERRTRSVGSIVTAKYVDVLLAAR